VTSSRRCGSATRCLTSRRATLSPAGTAAWPHFGSGGSSWARLLGRRTAATYRRNSAKHSTEAVRSTTRGAPTERRLGASAARRERRDRFGVCTRHVWHLLLMPFAVEVRTCELRQHSANRLSTAGVRRRQPYRKPSPALCGGDRATLSRRCHPAGVESVSATGPLPVDGAEGGRPRLYSRAARQPPRARCDRARHRGGRGNGRRVVGVDTLTAPLLADRVTLATTRQLGRPVITAERAWADVACVDVRPIR
jgi:hypothetical protein